MKRLFLSGWQDSNLRPPAPKAGAITGLRYTPNGNIRILLIQLLNIFQNLRPSQSKSGGDNQAEFIPMTIGTTPRMVIFGFC